MPRPGEIHQERKSLNEIKTEPAGFDNMQEDILNKSFDDGLVRNMYLEEEEQEEEQDTGLSKIKKTVASLFADDDDRDEEQKHVQPRQEVKKDISARYERLNSAFDRERTEEFLNEKLTAGYDMEKAKESFATQYKSIQKTEQDVAEISTLLHRMDTDRFVSAEKDTKMAKLAAIRGRKLSHLMLNDQKLTGDSELMDKVKDTLTDVETLMTAKQRRPLSVRDVDKIGGYYRSAIEACQTYCAKKNPWFSTGKRRKAKVEATLKRLMAEYDAVQLARFTIEEGGSEAEQVVSGIQLLSLAASQKLSDVMRNRKAEEDYTEKKDNAIREKRVYERLLKEKQEELKDSEQLNDDAHQLLQDTIAQKQPGYAEIKKEYEKLKAEFDVLYEEVGFAGLNMPSFLGGNDEIKELDKQVKDRKAKLDALEEQLIEDEDYKQATALAYSRQQEVDKLKADVRDTEFKVIQAENKYNGVLADERERLRIEKESRDKKREAAKTVTTKVRKEESKDNEDKIDSLPEELQPVIKLLVSGQEPTSVIKNKNKVSDKERTTLNLLLAVRKALSAFEKEQPTVKSLEIAGVMVTLIQDRFGNITAKYKDTQIPISNLAKQSAGAIADDVMKNQSVYGDEAVYDVILDLKTDLKDMSRGDLLRSREHAGRILFQLTGTPKTLMNNISVKDLRLMALEALQKKDDPEAFEKFKKFLAVRIESLNNVQKTSYVNTVLNRELQATGEQADGSVVINIEKKASNDGWNEREQPILDLVADLISMKDTVKADEVQEKRGERLKKVLINNAGAIALILSDQFRDKDDFPEGLVEGIVDKLPLFTMDEKGLEDLKSGLAEALGNIRQIVESNLGQNKMAGMVLGNSAALTPMIKKMLEEKLTPQKTASLGEVEDLLDDVISKSMNGVQEAFDKCIKDIFKLDDDKKEEQKEEKQEEQKQEEPGQEEKKELTDAEKAAEAEKKRLEKAKSVVAANTRKLNSLHENISKAETEVAELTKKRTELQASEKAESKAVKKNIESIDKLIDNAKQNVETLRALAPGFEEKISKNKKIIEAAAKKERMAAIQKRIDDRNESLKMYRDGIKNQQAVLAKGRFKFNMSKPEKQKYESNKVIIKDLKEELRAAQRKTSKELNKVIEDSVKGGKSGQSLFMKNVLTTYFRSMPKIDQRSMLASAVRNCKPLPKLSNAEMKNLTEDQKMEMMSDMIGGMFKGAGPLFQKMLQGLPIKSLPKGLRKAVEDTQDSLAPIPDEVVKAHMESIVERSHGKIDKIEVNKSLGAASVGQAFLCNIYGPDMKEGKRVVIKILRPDARNRMMREKEIMLEAARKTDEAGMHPFEVKQKRESKVMGGMEATYMGNLQRIEEELDLNIEANNCREGQVYDKRIYDKDTKTYRDNLSDSMKLSDLADPTSDTCMMEIAGTKTVKAYMSDVNEEVEKLLWRFCEKQKEKDSEGNETGREILKKNEDGSYKFLNNLSDEDKHELGKAQERMKELLTDMEKRQKSLAQLTEKWVTQGVFEKGFYHGDLHAGNIMISDTGVTVIDFGNATILKPEEQKQIVRMMVAATRGDVEKFRHGFHMLLKNTPEEVYQEKRDELTLILEDIMQTGDEKSAAERIAAALVRAQEIGLELPPTIANFSSCQMRLQNTLNDMNNNLKMLRKNTAGIMENDSSTVSQRDVDPIVALKYYNRQATVETFKNNIDKEIKKSDIKAFETGEQDLRKRLRDKKSRDSIREEYKLNKIDTASSEAIAAELDKLDRMIKGEIKPEITDELVEKFSLQGSDAFDELFPALANLRDNQKNENEQKFINTFMDKMETLFYDVEVDEEMHKLTLEKDPIIGKATSVQSVLEGIRQSAKNNEFKDCSIEIKATETEKKLQRFYDAQDNKAPKEELDQFENEVILALKAETEETIAKTKEEQKTRLMQKLPFDNAGNDEANKQRYDNFKFAIDTCLEGMADNTQLKEKADKLYKLCDDVLKGQKITDEKKQEIKNAFDEVFDLVWEARKEIMHKMKAEVKEPFSVNRSEPDDFLEIMGGVMYEKKGSVSMMLDPVTSVKIIWEEVKSKIFGD